MSEPYVAALSVAEFAALGRAGFRPCGLVLGVSVYRTGDPDDVGGSGEFVGLTEALYAARQRAMTRLEDEALQLGADGVVGVALTVDVTSLDGACRFVAVGTAVVADAPPPTGRWRNARDAPFTCTLDGHDVVTLLESGNAPVGVVLGASRYDTPEPDPEPVPAGEYADLTAAIYEARTRAISRVRAEAEELGADGVVGLAVEGLPPELAGPSQVLAIGTAVRRCRA